MAIGLLCIPTSSTGEWGSKIEYDYANAIVVPDKKHQKYKDLVASQAAKTEAAQRYVKYEIETSRIQVYDVMAGGKRKTLRNKK